MLFCGQIATECDTPPFSRGNRPCEKARRGKKDEKQEKRVKNQELGAKTRRLDGFYTQR